MKIKSISWLFLITIVICSCNRNVESTLNTNKSLAIDNTFSGRVDSLLTLMTLEEKIGQMNQYNGFWDVTGPVPEGGDAEKKYDHLRKGWVGSMLNVHGVENVRKVQQIAVEESRLGIPLIIGYDVIHGFKTISPIPLAEAASWDLDAIELSARFAASEAAAYGINWTFGPMVDISRDARWGRVMEGAGEDPFLGSRVAEARVKGFQGNNLSEINTIAACAKHFAGYGFAEAGRDYNTVDIGTSTLYNQVLPPFKAASDAGVKTFMNGFNILNGVPVTGSTLLQREILKGEWGFNGYVVTDWRSIYEMVNHGYAKDRKHATELAINAGSDMDMETYGYVEELVDLIKEGKVDEALVDDAVRRILHVKFELGLFDDPYKYCSEERQNASGDELHQKAVLEMAKKSIVLLKNESQLLPLKKKGQKIALIGGLAADKSSPLGSWRGASADGTAVSVLEGMQQYKENTLVYSKGANVTDEPQQFVVETKVSFDKSGFPEAIETARDADIVVMVLGEHGFMSGEGRSRTDIGIPGVQQELLEEVYKVNQNIVLVLNNGRPLAIPWAADNIPAIVEAWHLGTQSGHAIAQVLYGDYNPSGKLTISFPRAVGQVPIMYNRYNTGRPVNREGNVFWSHYIDEEHTPQFAFGHGLSYSEFSYSNLKVEVQSSKEVIVMVDVSNTSNVDGKEVVQLYIHDIVASVARPIKELKGFELIELAAGTTKTITFRLTDKELGFYNNDRKWVLEPGDFNVFVGGSSIETLEGSFVL